MGEITITQRIPLQRSPGVPLTGLPNTALGANASLPYNDEAPGGSARQRPAARSARQATSKASSSIPRTARSGRSMNTAPASITSTPAASSSSATCPSAPLPLPVNLPGHSARKCCPPSSPSAARTADSKPSPSMAARSTRLSKARSATRTTLSNARAQRHEKHPRRRVRSRRPKRPASSSTPWTTRTTPRSAAVPTRSATPCRLETASSSWSNAMTTPSSTWTTPPRSRKRSIVSTSTGATDVSRHHRNRRCDRQDR